MTSRGYRSPAKGLVEHLRLGRVISDMETVGDLKAWLAEVPDDQPLHPEVELDVPTDTAAPVVLCVNSEGMPNMSLR